MQFFLIRSFSKENPLAQGFFFFFSKWPNCPPSSFSFPLLPLLLHSIFFYTCDPHSEAHSCHLFWLMADLIKGLLHKMICGQIPPLFDDNKYPRMGLPNRSTWFDHGRLSWFNHYNHSVKLKIGPLYLNHGILSNYPPLLQLVEVNLQQGWYDNFTDWTPQFPTLLFLLVLRKPQKHHEDVWEGERGPG